MVCSLQDCQLPMVLKIARRPRSLKFCGPPLKFLALISRFYVLQEHAAHRNVFGYAAREKLKAGDGQREAGCSFWSLDQALNDSQNMEMQINERRMSNSQERDDILRQIQGITEMVQPGTHLNAEMPVQEALNQVQQVQDGFQTPRRPIRPLKTPPLQQHPLSNPQSAPQRSSGIIANRIRVGAELLAASMNSSQSNYCGGSGTKTSSKRRTRQTPQNGHGGRGKHPLQFQTPARGEALGPYASTPAGSILRQYPPSDTPKSNPHANANPHAVVNVDASGSGYVTPEKIGISRNQELFLSSQARRTTSGRSQHERVPNSRFQPLGLLPRLMAVGNAITQEREHSGSHNVMLKVVACFKHGASRYCTCEWISGSAEDISSFLTTPSAPNLNSVNTSHVIAIFSDQNLEGGDILPGHVLYVWPPVIYHLYMNDLFMFCHGKVQQSVNHG